MPNDGKNLKVTETYLEDFAQRNIQPLIEEIDKSDVMSRLRNFSGAGQLGQDAVGHYSQVLTGNPAANLASAPQLTAKFKELATSLSGNVDEFKKNLDTLRTDLRAVDSVLKDGDESAQLTAQQMQMDLQSISWAASNGGAGGGGAGGGAGGAGGGGAGGAGGGSGT